MSQFSSFKAMCCKITSSSLCAQVICLYRQPGYPTLFFEQFQDLLENMSSFARELFIFCDFNLHLDSQSNHTNTFTNFLSPTFMGTGSTCLLGLTWTACDHDKDCTSIWWSIWSYDSDSRCWCQTQISKCFSYRCVKGIPLTDFTSDIKLSALISHSKLTCSELYQQYHTVLRSLLNK